MPRRRPLVSQINRDSYLISRAAWTARAIQRGRLPQRLIRRPYHRQAIRFLRRAKLW
jgi:hypothetical protein